MGTIGIIKAIKYHITDDDEIDDTRIEILATFFNESTQSILSTQELHKTQSIDLHNVEAMIVSDCFHKLKCLLFLQLTSTFDPDDTKWSSAAIALLIAGLILLLGLVAFGTIICIYRYRLVFIYPKCYF
jgi:hypothetical protein